MSALLLLALAASEPSVVTEPPPEPAVQVAPVSWGEAPPPAPPEPDLGAQLSFVAVETLNGAWIGLNACGLVACYSEGSGLGLLVSGVAGAGAGFALSGLNHGLASDWGRAALLDSASVAAALGSFYLAARPPWPSSELRYLIAGGLDAALTLGVAALAPHVAPRPEAVWLANSLALWSWFLGGAWAAVIGQPQAWFDLSVASAAAGGLLGALLAASAERMSPWRFWRANLGALLGGLLLGGGLAAFELWSVQLGHGYDQTVPAVGAIAGITGGFLVGFALSEER